MFFYFSRYNSDALRILCFDPAGVGKLLFGDHIKGMYILQTKYCCTAVEEEAPQEVSYRRTTVQM